MITPEKFLDPKELSAAMLDQYGLAIKTRHIWSIRAACAQRSATFFVIGRARPSELMQWLKDNPTFQPHPRKREAVESCAC